MNYKINVKRYQIIEHTADIGIKAYGQDLKELFVNAAVGMFDIIVGPRRAAQGAKQKLEIQKQAEDRENLLVEWLGELLFLFSTKDIVFESFEIEKLDEKHIKAVVIAGSLENYKIETEIKAVTYHMIEVKQEEGVWEAVVIFDI